MSQTFQLGLVGGGRMGQMHLDAISASALVSFVAVAEPHLETANHLRKRGLRVYSDLAELLGRGGVDGVVVAAPTDRHLKVVEEVAAAGLPILCEKPCGIDSVEAQAAGAAATRNNVPIQAAYWRRFVPGLRVIREAISAGDLGSIHLLNCTQWDESPPRAEFRRHSGGIFIDMGVHEIDQMRWLSGQDVSEAFATAYPTTEDAEAEDDLDSAQALIMLSGGTTGVISLGRFHAGGDFVRAEAFGSKGHQQIPIVSPEIGDRWQLEALRLQAEAFARHARGGPQEGSTIADAQAALKVAELLTDAVGADPIRGAE